MRTTVTIDDALYESAVEAADPGMDRADIIREAIKVFVRVQAGKRLAALGGKTPAMKVLLHAVSPYRARRAAVPHRECRSFCLY
ncbi:MAG: hypothetical protein U1F35_16055 [Steroidobacteraceae bacterium]